MAVEPLAPAPDDKDWTWVLERSCPQCGFDAGALEIADIGHLVRGTAAAFVDELRRPSADEREQSDVWSVLEYGCHVRDVCRLFDERARQMLRHDDPVFLNWDQDETALADRYWTQDRGAVAAALSEAADAVAHTFDGVHADQWSRPGRRSNGSVFTVESLARYFLHDLVHHLHDIRPPASSRRN